MVFTDPREAVLFADLTGDGLLDIVRVRNGSVRYWPNQGYGRFGRALDLGNVGLFDDVDGSTLVASGSPTSTVRRTPT